MPVRVCQSCLFGQAGLHFLLVPDDGLLSDRDVEAVRLVGAAATGLEPLEGFDDAVIQLLDLGPPQLVEMLHRRCRRWHF